MSTITIECKDIKKCFRSGESRFEVLHGISFTTYEREMIMIMGPSGAGKTTILSILGGILQQDSGECLIMNKPINALPSQEKTMFRGKNIGFIFQQFLLVPTLTALENAAIPLLCMGKKREDAFKQASDLLEQFGLKKVLDHRPDELSGGEQQRVAIARAVINYPKVILCDEPTSSLDSESGKHIMEILSEIKHEYACTLIIVTHDPRIVSFADRIITIEDGRIKSLGKSDEQ